VTRHYLGISPRGPTVYRNVRKDETGEPLLLIDQDAVVKLTIDFSDWLETGETLSSVSATARSCTIAVSTTSPRTVITISDVTSHHDGDITIIATSSTGEKYREIIRVRRTNRYTDEALVFSDYV
jgi:hypothetical protein